MGFFAGSDKTLWSRQEKQNVSTQMDYIAVSLCNRTEFLLSKEALVQNPNGS